MTLYQKRRIFAAILLALLFVVPLAAEEAIYYSLITDDTYNDCALYRMDTTGENQTAVFSFSNMSVANTGSIFDLRQAPDGTLYFKSNYANYWTIASTNICRVKPDGSDFEQITPGPESGKFNLSGPTGTVIGTVTQGGSSYISGAPVYCEGVQPTATGADGSFTFTNVPVGTRYVVAYTLQGYSVYGSQTVTVLEGQTTSVNIEVTQSGRASFGTPVVYGSRIYNVLAPGKLQYTDSQGYNQTDVYLGLTQCVDVPGINGYDVAPTSGKLVISDYKIGCTTNVGIYTADSDGGSVQTLLDMKQPVNGAYPWQGVDEVFWSPDEKYIAFNAGYQFYDYSGFSTVYSGLYVLDASTGAILGDVQFQNTGLTTVNTTIHGWNPSGNKLLYSVWADPSQTELYAIGVNTDGSFDTNDVTTLLQNVYLGSATWAAATQATPGDNTPTVSLSLSGGATSSGITIYNGESLGLTATVSGSIPSGAKLYLAVDVNNAGTLLFIPAENVVSAPMEAFSSSLTTGQTYTALSNIPTGQLPKTNYTFYGAVLDQSMQIISAIASAACLVK